MAISSITTPIEPTGQQGARSRSPIDQTGGQSSFVDQLNQLDGSEKEVGIKSSEPAAPETPSLVATTSGNLLDSQDSLSASMAASGISDEQLISTETNVSSEIILEPETLDTPLAEFGLPQGAPQLAVQELASEAPDLPGDLPAEPEGNGEGVKDPETDSVTIPDLAALTPAQLLLTVLPVPASNQNVDEPKNNISESEGKDGPTPSSSIPTPMITLKSLSALAGSQQSADDGLNDPGTDEPEVDVTDGQPLDAGSFEDILTKSTDISLIKQGLTDLQKIGSSPQTVAASGGTTSLSDLPIEIGMRMLEGAREIRIVLSPETLGEIAIKLDIAADSSISAQFSTDNPATLALLMQDASALKRSLDPTGMTPRDATLQFSLSNGGHQNGHQQGQNSQENNQKPTWTPAYSTTAMTEAPELPLRSYSLQRLDRII